MLRQCHGHACLLEGALEGSSGVQLWRHAMNFTAEVVLEGIAKAGSRGKCTPMGRAAMSLDLQVTQRSAHNPESDVEGCIALHGRGAKLFTLLVRMLQ